MFILWFKVAHSDLIIIWLSICVYVTQILKLWHCFRWLGSSLNLWWCSSSTGLLTTESLRARTPWQCWRPFWWINILNTLNLSIPILLWFSVCDLWWTLTSDVLVAQDGIVDPLDSTLRDFSGTCIQEFVKWSIKQTTPKQQEKSPANIKSLFKRIYSLALHPNVFKRLGAALAFNSMYRHFRSVRVLFEFNAGFIWSECLSKYYYLFQRRELFGWAVCLWDTGGVYWELGLGPLWWEVSG